MSYTPKPSVSPYLTAERDRLLQQILDLHSAGRIAPAYYWLKEESQTKGNTTYSYVRLVIEPPDTKTTSQSLGKPGSAKHQDWKQAIARRVAIAELEQQLQMVEAIIDRQVAATQQISIAAMVDSDYAARLGECTRRSSSVGWNLLPPETLLKIAKRSPEHSSCKTPNSNTSQ